MGRSQLYASCPFESLNLPLLSQFMVHNSSSPNPLSPLVWLHTVLTLGKLLTNTCPQEIIESVTNGLASYSFRVIAVELFECSKEISMVTCLLFNALGTEESQTRIFHHPVKESALK